MQVVRRLDIGKVIHNVSKYNLSEGERTILREGFNICHDFKGSLHRKNDRQRSNLHIKQSRRSHRTNSTECSIYSKIL